MKIVEETIRRITISHVPSLDPIRVALEDIGPGQGRINIECYGTSWAYYWGGMGKETIAEFFSTCDKHYLAGKLAPELRSNVFDPDALRDHLKAEIINERKKLWIGKRVARTKFDCIEEIDFAETVDGLMTMDDTMHELLGDEWWNSLPEKKNPDYEYLCRIIRTVQEALTVAQGGAA